MSREPRQTNDDRDIATLIRTAGPRPAVPAERMERVRAAAAESWRHENRLRSRRRRRILGASLAVAATLVLAVALKLLLPSGGEAPEAWLLVQAVSGSAWATPPGGEAVQVVSGARIAVATELRTAEDARLALGLASGHSIRLDHATRVRFAGEDSVVLQRGAIYVDSGSDEPDGRAITVHTPFGRIEEIGTRFEVRLDTGAVRVRLRDGRVILHGDDASYPVTPGIEFALSSDGSTATQTVASHDAAWAWTATVAPPFELEGSTARAFLNWVAHERGLRLVFADEQLAQSAGGVVLAGNLEGVPVEEALDVVLPTCRMRHSITDGILTIDAEPVP